MPKRSKSLVAYDRGYNQARRLFDNDQLDEAVDIACDMLDDNGSPRYHRIKLLLLVAASAEDWWDVDQYLEQAQTLWLMARRFNPVGADEAVDAAMQELRGSLDTVQADHDSKRPDDEGVNEDIDEELGLADIDREEDVDVDVLAGEEKGGEEVEMADEEEREAAPVCLSSLLTALVTC